MIKSRLQQLGFELATMGIGLGALPLRQHTTAEEAIIYRTSDFSFSPLKL